MVTEYPAAGPEIANLIGGRVPLPDEIAGICRGDAETLARMIHLLLGLLTCDSQRDFVGQRLQGFECMFRKSFSREHRDHTHGPPVEHQPVAAKAGHGYAPVPFLV